MSEDTCTLPECVRPSNVPGAARGWCRPHYRRWQRHGDPLAGAAMRKPAARKPAKNDGPCEAHPCTEPAYALGLCRGHHNRLHKVGSVRAEVPFKAKLSRGKVCTHRDGCAGRVKARDLCRKHYGESFRVYVAADPVRAEAARRYSREWKAAEYRRDPGRARAIHKAWKCANPERARLHHARKMRQRRGARRAPFTVDQLAAKIAHWGGACWVCRAPWEALDHVKPLARGGWHMLANLRPICTSCNSTKGATWPYPTAARQ